MERTERRIVEVHITEDEERVKQCKTLTPEGFARWQKDKGKTVRAVIPPYPKELGDPCELPLRWEIIVNGLTPKPKECMRGNVPVLCAHFLDMD